MATIASPRPASPAASNRITSPTVGPQSPSPSGAGTPTSSVRPSVDLPRNDGHPSNPTQEQSQTQRRNRAALRDYYNLKAKPQDLQRSASIGSTISTATADTTTGANVTNDTATSPHLAQLDQTNFKSQGYINELLSTASLRDLLRTESALVSEIRTLDGERKALVYDNYSKLISAVETLGQMTQKVGEVSGAGLKGLEEKLGALESVVREVGIGHEDGGEEVEEGRKMKMQRQKVRWILDAPRRLKGLVEEGKREKAEREWEEVQKLLERWDGVKGVAEVRSKCEQIMGSEAPRKSDDGG